LIPGNNIVAVNGFDTTSATKIEFTYSSRFTGI
jgi:hypothetical protein